MVSLFLISWAYLALAWSWKQKHMPHLATIMLHCHMMIQNRRKFWSAGNQEEVKTALTSLTRGPWGRGYLWLKGQRQQDELVEPGGSQVAGCTSAWRHRTSQGNSKESHAPLGTRLESHLQRRQVEKVHPHAVMQTPPWRLWFPQDAVTGLKPVSSAVSYFLGLLKGDTE